MHSSHLDADNATQTDTTGVSDPSLPQASSSIPVQGVSQFSTPPLSPKPPHDRAYQQCQLGAMLRKLPALALTPQCTHSHGFLTPLPPGPPKTDRRVIDKRLIEAKYQDLSDENERLRKQVSILEQNQAKLSKLLEATDTDCIFA